MDMEPYQIAFLPLARMTFDIPLAEEMTRKARTCLKDANLGLIGPKKLITDLASAQAAASELSEKTPDLVVIFQATFADSTMVALLTEAIDAPVFLWAIPEPMTGERLRLNSLCGINLAGHALTLKKHPYSYTYAKPEDPAVIDQIRALAAAGNIRRRLRSARLGVIGEHPAGMDSCHLDQPLLESKLGIQVVRIDLERVFEHARCISNGILNKIHSQLILNIKNLDELDQTSLMGSLSVYSALKQITEEENLQALAVRCWPEFFTELGCAACGAMSMLSDGFDSRTPIPCSCEADVNGTVIQLILQWAADAPAFGTDIVAMDFEEDIVALWHCGLAPLSMANPAVEPQGGIHSNRQVPLVMEFPLKPGRVTIARLSRASGELRFVLGRGEMLPSPQPFTGTSGVLRLETPARQFFDHLLQEGLEHHVSLVYGDHLASMMALADLLELPVLRL
jgi:L-fucose isomerase-like protein